MSTITVSLAVIERELQRMQRRMLLGALRPGLPAESVRLALEPFALSGVSGLEELYGWRNGTAASRDHSIDDWHLFPGFYLLSLEDAVANLRAFSPDPRWTPEWLPIFANGGGDFYLIDYTVTKGPVRHFRIEEMEHPVEFSSLESMLATIAAGFERGIIFVAPGGYLEIDDLAFALLAAEMNPEIAWWRD